MSFINFNILGNEVPINAHAITVIKVVPSAPDKWLVQVDWMPKNSAIVKLNEAGYYETQELAQAAADILAQEVADIINAGVQSDWEQTNTTKVDYIKNKPNLSDYVKNTIKINGKQLTSNITLLSKDIITDSEDGFFAGQTIEASLEYLNTNLGDKNVKADWTETDSTKDSYIENKPTIPSISGLATEQWVLNKHYLTAHQSLADYYKKSEVNNLISQIPKFKILIVEELPSADIDLMAIYVVGSSGKEYIYLESEERWEMLGLLAPNLELYYTKLEADNEFVKQTININGKDLSDDITIMPKDIPLGEYGIVPFGNLEQALEMLNTNLGDKNVKADWTQEVNTADDYIKNKPTIPTKISDLTNDTGYITDYTETDPIFTAWDKSTGISIAKSQVSDFAHDHNNLYYTEAEIDFMLQGLPVDGHTHTESDITDLDKYTQAQVDTLLNNKVDKVTDKGLSTEDYTTTEKNKLAGIASGAEVNVQSDWTQEVNTADDYIKNKPVIPTKISDLTNDTGYITDYTETDPIFTAWDKSTGISITKSQVSDLIAATQSLPGLMSAADKTRLDVLHALLEEDEENSVVDSINEVLAIFNNYPEGADLVTALAGKVDKIVDKSLVDDDEITKLEGLDNQTTLDGKFALKVNTSDIVDNLTSTDTNKPLSAKQGKVLNDTIGNIDAILNSILGV